MAPKRARSPAGGRGFGSPSPPVRLSACLITKNEAERLPACLGSVRDLADELVVVDTGSTDDTVAIARSLGAKVYEFAWCDDFAAARNASLRYATGTWVLVLDADEVLEPAAIPPLRRLMDAPDCLAVTLLRWEVGATQAPYSVLARLFRRHGDVVFEGIYHESVDRALERLCAREPHWRLVHLPVPALRHGGYQPDVLKARQKSQFAARLMQKHLDRFPNDAYMLAKLGALHAAEGDLDRGIELLERGLAIECGGERRPAVLYELFLHAAIAQTQRAQYDLAVQFYQEAIAQPIVPTSQVAAYTNLAGLHLQQGRLTEAIALYERVTELAPTFARGFYNLGVACKQAHHLPAAIAAYQRAIALDPDDGVIQQNLGVALFQAGRSTEAWQVFRGAIAAYERQGNRDAARHLQGILQEIGLG